jgi:hypothetical protein
MGGRANAAVQTEIAARSITTVMNQLEPTNGKFERTEHEVTEFIGENAAG